MRKKSQWMATTEIKIPFQDIDAMRIVWHGNYLRYFEVARCTLLDSIDYNYKEMSKSGFAWPVVDVKMHFGASAEFQDIVKVTTAIREYEKCLKIAYEIRNVATGKRLTRGSTTQVAVRMSDNQLCYESPKILLQKLGVSE